MWTEHFFQTAAAPPTLPTYVFMAPDSVSRVTPVPRHLPPHHSKPPPPPGRHLPGGVGGAGKQIKHASIESDWGRKRRGRCGAVAQTVWSYLLEWWGGAEGCKIEGEGTGEEQMKGRKRRRGLVGGVGALRFSVRRQQQSLLLSICLSVYHSAF